MKRDKCKYNHSLVKKTSNNRVRKDSSVVLLVVNKSKLANDLFAKISEIWVKVRIKIRNAMESKE
jgi:hypothetical protein